MRGHNWDDAVAVDQRAPLLTRYEVYAAPLRPPLLTPIAVCNEIDAVSLVSEMRRLTGTISVPCGPAKEALIPP